MTTSTKNCLDKLNETKPEYLKIEREKSGSWELDVSNKRVPTIWYIFFYPFLSLFFFMQNVTLYSSVDIWNKKKWLFSKCAQDRLLLFFLMNYHFKQQWCLNPPFPHWPTYISAPDIKCKTRNSIIFFSLITWSYLVFTLWI